MVGFICWSGCSIWCIQPQKPNGHTTLVLSGYATDFCIDSTLRNAVSKGFEVVVAGDASGNTRDKLIPLLEARRVPYALACDRARLGEAVGRAPLGAVAVVDPSLAARIRELLAAIEDPE